MKVYKNNGKIKLVSLQIKRDIRLFKGITKQFIFISSASAYQKPLSHYKITESTPVPGFIATTRFDQGVKLSIEHILSHPGLQIEDSEFDLFCEKIISSQKQAVIYFKNL